MKRDELLREYSDQLDDYYSFVSRLLAVAGTRNNIEFKKVFNECMRRQNCVTLARVDLEIHRDEHNC